VQSALKELNQKNAQAELIAALIDLRFTVLQLLGRSVVGRAWTTKVNRSSETFLVEQARDTKINDLWRPVGSDQNVVWFHVSMHDPFCPDETQAENHVPQEEQRCSWLREFCNASTQRARLDVFFNDYKKVGCLDPEIDIRRIRRLKATLLVAAGEQEDLCPFFASRRHGALA
jgi:hypothetical protein